MDLDSPETPSEARFRRSLPLTIASPIFLLAAVMIAGIVVPDHWNWDYLIWGIGIGILSAANQQLAFYVVPKMMGATSDQSARLQRQGRLRKRVNMFTSISLGIAMGALSAIFDNIFFVLFGTIVLILANVIPYIVVPVILKRAIKRQAG